MNVCVGSQFPAVRAILCLVVLLAGISTAQGNDRAIAYVLSCRKPNGAFGPRDQEYTDAAWNYPAVHALRLLGAEIEHPEQVLAHGLGYPAGHAGVGHWLVFHQAMIGHLLEEHGEGKLPPTKVALAHQGYEIRYYGSPLATEGKLIFNADGRGTAERFAQAETLGYYNLSSLYYTLAALAATGRQARDPAALVEFITARQAPGGGFVDLRTADGKAADAETHLASTYHAVAALRLLGADIPRAADVVRFVQSCQVVREEKSRDAPGPDEFPLPNGQGGFRWHPDRGQGGNVPDVYYTWCGLQTLRLLDAAPRDIQPCGVWVASLQNDDGGYGDRPDWRSRLYSTYYALHALAILNQMQANPTVSPEAVTQETPLDRIVGARLKGFGVWKSSATRQVARNLNERELERQGIPEKSHLYQALFKTPVVEPDDLPGLQRRGLNLLAMKTADFDTATPLLRRIAQSRLAMDVVLCPEAYPHRARARGGALLHHVGNFTLDPRWSAEQRRVWDQAQAAGAKGLPWDEYRRQVLGPLAAQGSLCYPEQDFEMEHAYAAYDAGLYGQQGYNAVQAGFNWAPRDFVRVFPWRERYVDKLPMVADADAHGDLAKWSPQLDHVRHFYVAETPDYAAFLHAAQRGRVVTVIAQPAGVPSGVTYYGSESVVDQVRARRDQWQWWPAAER